MATDVTAELLDAKDYAEAENYAKAWPIVSKVLNEEPDNPQALCLAAAMMNLQGNAGIAYQVMKRVTHMFPNNPTGWLNLGKSCDDLWKMDEAEACYRRALNNVKAGDEQTKMLAFNNLSAMYVQMGKYQQGRHYAERALQIDPTHLKARHNVGLSMLAQHDWKHGWKQYEASIGSPHRLMFKYGDEPEWKGQKDATVAIYGEQGIGDEICAASIYNDAIKDCKKLVIDCDARLKNIFQRSFPKAKVYGTRTQKVLNWDEEDHQIDYSLSAVQLGGIYRLYDDSFDGKPYLTADQDRVLMWKALWKTKEKPVLGIAWTGGVRSSAARYRIWNHEHLAEIMRTVDAHWVCLQYKDAEAELVEFRKKYPDIDIKQYPHATLTQDYDDMCSLVASLDGVVAMQSTAVHTAGALGIPCIAGIPATSQWRYGSEGETMPWYACVKLCRQKDYNKWDLSGIKAWLKQYRSLSATT